MAVITNTLAALALLLAAAMLAQIDALIDEAKKGGTLGGQALLFLVVILLIWAVRNMYNSGKATTAIILAAADTQRNEDRKRHEALLEASRTEREVYTAERSENFQVLLRIAGESARALEATASAINAQAASAAINAQATATAINAQVAATDSLRHTMHGIQGELQSKQTARDERK